MDGSFKKVGSSKRKMYGKHEAVLICGYNSELKAQLSNLIKKIGITAKIIFPDNELGTKTLKEILEMPDNYGFEKDSDFKPNINISGLTEEDFHKILDLFRNSGLPAPLIAALTPTSENWTIPALQKELEAEAAAFEQMNSQNK